MPASGNPPVRSAAWFRQLSLLLPPSIAGRLVLLVAVILVPLSLVQLTAYWNRYQREEAAVRQANLELARMAARSFQVYLQDILHQQLAIGRYIAAERAPSTEQINQFLAENVSEYAASGIRSYHWVDPAGRIAASSSPDAVGLYVGDRPYFQQVQNGDEWAISDLLRSRVDGAPTFLLARGTRGGEGQLLGVVVASIDPGQLDQALQVDRAGEGALALIDRQGFGVYRYPSVPMTWEQRNWAPTQPLVQRALAGEETTGTFVSVFDQQTRVAAIVPVAPIGWAVSSNVPEEAVFAQAIGPVLPDAALALAVAVVATALALALARTISDPIEQLRAATRVYGEGRFDGASPVTGPAEVQQLAGTLNDMARQLHGLEEQRQDFLRAVSHDLRAPLTVMLGNAQMLQRAIERGDTAALARKAEAIIAEVRRSEAMIQELVETGKIEGGTVQLNLQPVALLPFLDGLAARLTSAADTGRIQIEAQPGLPPVAADPDQLARILTNLLTNALKYSTPGTEVTVRLTHAGGFIHIEVADRGPGIAPEQLPRLFQRYQRLPGPAQQREGLGLGLYITKGLVEAHGGRIWAESAAGAGSQFHVTLPAFEGQQRPMAISA